jgi:hypothetical protein
MEFLFSKVDFCNLGRIEEGILNFFFLKHNLYSRYSRCLFSIENFDDIAMDCLSDINDDEDLTAVVNKILKYFKTFYFVAVI